MDMSQIVQERIDNLKSRLEEIEKENLKLRQKVEIKDQLITSLEETLRSQKKEIKNLNELLSGGKNENSETD